MIKEDLSLDETSFKTICIIIFCPILLLFMIYYVRSEANPKTQIFLPLTFEVVAKRQRRTFLSLKLKVVDRRYRRKITPLQMYSGGEALKI